MRGDIDIRLIDYYIYDLTEFKKAISTSDNKEKAEPDIIQSEEESSPELSDKH
jgi:hypothetical protein